MEKYICIHGHFYQPPRENAWLEFVEVQDSAYPYHDWNERITSECYAPNGTSRILDGYNNVVKIVNNYSYISFNFGPTLLAWMADREPDVYRRILEADKESQQRYSGHGSAIAQAFSHTILPLSNSRDKYTQVLWGIRDFQYRFGRYPEGMWLPETAVDLETLDILANLGIRFTILSPYQARRVKRLRGKAWKDVNGGRVDPSTPYVVKTPAGKQIVVFFYDGPISQAIAFERLLIRGENLAGRLMSAFSPTERPWPQLVHIATDGETYGHHHQRGDMALAYALNHIEENDLAKLTNYGEYLSMHRPRMEAEIWERSAWSCPHGVERWNSNCGCNSGGHPEWNQEWRLPLRQAFDWLRDTIVPRFEEKGRELFANVWSARNDYISVILNREVTNREKFFTEHATHKLSRDEQVLALKLLEMQRYAMLMYTSCGWFFDELSGIETTQVIQYAARAIRLYEEVFSESIEEPFLQKLERAKSNLPEHKDGRVIYNKFVKPASVDRESVAAHYALSSVFEPYPDYARVYCYSVARDDYSISNSGKTSIIVGRVRVISEITTESGYFTFAAVHMGDHMVSAGVQPFHGEEDYSRMRDELQELFRHADLQNVLRTIDRHFGTSTYSLRSIFYDDQRRIMNVVVETSLADAEAVYRQLYETHGPMMRFMSDLRMPPPRAFQVAADFALNNALRHSFEDADNLDFARIETLLEEARANNVNLDGPTLGFALKKTLRRLSEQFLETPEGLPLLQKFEKAADMARQLPFEVSVWHPQNNYYALLQRVFPEMMKRAQAGNDEARQWIEHFTSLGKHVAVRVDVPENLKAA
jgi:alpha-amylase/alpha-mannosidase (GH57 family)